MRKFLFLLIPTAICINTLAQTQFERVIGGAGADHSFGIVQTSDGGYLLSGITTSYGAGGEDVLLTRLDSLGNTIWSKTYGGTSDEEWSASIVETSDSGFVVVTRTLSFGSNGLDGYVFKIDAAGNLLWDKRYSNPSSDSFRNIYELSTGELLITGTSNLIIGSADGILIKLTAGGNVIWTKIIGGATNDHFAYVREQSNGNYILCGRTQSWGPPNHNFLVMNTDTAGNIIWQVVAGGSAIDMERGLELTSGGFVIPGASSSWAGSNDMILLQYDLNGTLVWTKAYGGPMTDEPIGIRVLPSGNMLIYGFTESFGAGQKDMLLIKTDVNGNLIWAKTYGGSNMDEGGTICEPLELTNDNGIVIAGSSNSYGAGGYDQMLIKTDTMGTLFCNDISSQITVSNITPTVATPNLTIVSAGTYSNPATIVNTVATTDANPCVCSTGSLTVSFSADTTNGLTVDFTDLTSGGISWNWDFGDGNFSTNQNPQHTYATFGTYTACLIVSDGCLTDTLCQTFSIQGALPMISASAADALCAGACDGSASATVTGGTSPYTYLWSSGSTDSTATGLCAGIHVVTATDQNGDTATAMVTVTEPSAIQLNTGSVSETCGASDGSATATTTGGSSPYSFMWSNGQVDSTATGLSAGTYSVTITDANGCIDSSSVTVQNNVTPPTASITGGSMLCSGSSMLLEATGGGSYAWSTGATGSQTNVAPTSTTTYYVTATTACGTGVDSITVQVVTPPTANAIGDTSVYPGSATPLIVYGNGNYYWWPGTGLSCTNCANPMAIVEQTTTYYVTVSQNGCIATDSVTVTVFETGGPLGCMDEIYIPNIFSPNNDSKNDMLFVRGGTVEVIEFSIYNRWGQRVFKGGSSEEGWDGNFNGKPVNASVFVWYLNARCIYAEETFQLQGNVTVIR